MRKPRDFDGELKALQDKARDLKSRKVQQLGELVIATGADSLSVDELAALGYKIVVCPIESLLVAGAAIQRLISAVLSRGRLGATAGPKSEIADKPSKWIVNAAPLIVANGGSNDLLYAAHGCQPESRLLPGTP